MKQWVTVTLCSLALGGAAGSWPAAGAEDETPAGPLPPTVTAEVLEGRIAETEGSPDLPDEVRTQLVELYRRALSHLAETRVHAARAAALEEATRTAPAQTQLIRDEIEASRGTDLTARLDVGRAATLEELEQVLREHEADLAGAEARRADFEGRLAYHRDRPAAIAPRLGEVRRRQEETAAALKAPAAPGDSPALAQARRWVLETRSAALAAEIRSLDQELRGRRLRVELLEARRDREAGRAEGIGAGVAALSDRVNRQRRLEAEEATAEAEEALREMAGLHPLLVRLSRENAALTQDLNAMSARLDALDRERSEAERLARRVEADHRDAATTVEAGGVTEELGGLLLEQRRTLPDVELYRRRARAHEERLAEAGVRQLRHQGEARRTAEVDRVVTELESRMAGEVTAQTRQTLRRLVEKRRALLEKALEADAVDLRRLRELQAAERQLLEAVGAYDDFLDAQLLWLRNTEPIHHRDLRRLPSEVRHLLAPAAWSGLAGVFADQVTRSPLFWVALLLAAGLLWRRRAVLAAIEETAPSSRPESDSFSRTLRGLVLTLVTAAPLSLLLAATGAQLRFAGHGTDLSRAVGFSLLHVAMHLYVLRVARMVCLPHGLGAAHFLWPEPAVGLLRRQLDRLTGILVLAVLVVRLAVDLNPVEAGGSIARLAFVVYAGIIVLFLYRVLHPQRGVFAHRRAGERDGWVLRAYPVWWPLLLAFPAALAGLAFAGYLYTAWTLYFPYQHSLWLIAGLVGLDALALRGLRVVQRRLAWEAAVERRQAAVRAERAPTSTPGGEESAALQVEEPDVDLEALSDDTRELLQVAAVFGGLLGLYLLWTPMLPALRIFEQVTLWYRTVTVDGEVLRLPVTLANAGLAIVYGIATGVLAWRVPALLEIVLLRADVSSGNRYTATTLCRYAIVAVGVGLVLGTLGARWTQFQWLVAALGVGIGFGLQEIVANFISGLIMLFERPIRVGDIVTVGETDGVVTRIQIRATTVRGWDRKELLVPNKEFITGRVLNWTLSDQVARVMVVVGVAYGTDVDRALALMREAAEENERVLDDPAPLLTFEGFGDNALNLILRAYIGSIEHRLATITDLHRSVSTKFGEAGITIAFPQRDLHVDAREPLRIRLEDER